MQIATAADTHGAVLLQTLPPHAPCRLQRRQRLRAHVGEVLCLHTLRADCNIPNGATVTIIGLCLHTLRADCNPVPSSPAKRPAPLPPHAPCRLQPARNLRASPGPALPPHAPCRLQQVRAPRPCRPRTLPPHAPCRLQLTCPTLSNARRSLPPHAPCRLQLECDPRAQSFPRKYTFASTRSVQIATHPHRGGRPHGTFASTRSVQIATPCAGIPRASWRLCLHTLRADCNSTAGGLMRLRGSLPPHAPCRLQPDARTLGRRERPFASTRSVQIATAYTSS